MEANLKIEMSGHYKIVATKKDGSQRVLADWFENLILDAGLNRLGVGGAWDRAQVGSGSTVPDVGQTALTTLVATTTTIQSTTAGTDTPTNTYAWARRTYRFAEGAAAGNLSEVGVGWAAAGGGLFSRSLIKDDLGNPTTITVLSDEALDIIYEIRAYPNTANQTTTLTISGVTYTFTIRPAYLSGNQSSLTQWPEQLVSMMTSGVISATEYRLGWYAYAAGSTLGAITGFPSGTQLVAPSNTANTYSFTSAYSNNSFQRQCRVRMGLNAGNAAFGALVVVTSVGDWQMTVSPNLPKDATKILTLDFTLSWARKTI